MKICPHDLATKETACADGMCPICAADDARGYEFEIERLRAELTDAKERAKTAEENWHKNEARFGKLQMAVTAFLKEVPESEMNLAREILGNTNTRIIIEKRRELETALKGSA